MGRRINQVIGQEATAVEDAIPLFIFRREIGIGRGDKKIFTVNLVAAFGKEADVGGRGGTKIEYA